MIELRCNFKLHGILDEKEHCYEVRCHSARCGYSPGVVVLHRFGLSDGNLIDTRVFRDPDKKGK